VKKVIELLEEVESSVMLITDEKLDRGIRELCNDAINYLNDAMAILKAHRWETPEEWGRRTGELLLDRSPVYVRFRNRYVREENYYWLLYEYYQTRAWRLHNPIICATEAGPPPDDWRPEEAVL
jgi:hypothetical protein